jgi:hypothetical protein
MLFLPLRFWNNKRFSCSLDPKVFDAFALICGALIQPRQICLAQDRYIFYNCKKRMPKCAFSVNSQGKAPPISRIAPVTAGGIFNR